MVKIIAFFVVGLLVLLPPSVFGMKQIPELLSKHKWTTIKNLSETNTIDIFAFGPANTSFEISDYSHSSLITSNPNQKYTSHKYFLRPYKNTVDFDEHGFAQVQLDFMVKDPSIFLERKNLSSVVSFKLSLEEQSYLLPIVLEVQL